MRPGNAPCQTPMPKSADGERTRLLPHTMGQHKRPLQQLGPPRTRTADVTVLAAASDPGCGESSELTDASEHELGHAGRGESEFATFSHRRSLL
jgi:hypothetical protein